jgi:hypothetical protein
MLVVIAALGACGGSAQRKRPNILGRLHALEDAINAYHTAKSVFPDRLDDLGLPPEAVKDSWGRALGYVHDDRCFAICHLTPPDMQDERALEWFECLHSAPTCNLTPPSRAP